MKSQGELNADHFSAAYLFSKTLQVMAYRAKSKTSGTSGNEATGGNVYASDVAMRIIRR
jgi:hypothetical protein